MANKRGNDMRFTVTTTKDCGGQKPEGTVFMAIDTSGSMSGAKIQEVSTAVKDIIRQCPNYVRFVIRKFDMNVTTIVSKKKNYLDIDRLLADLRICGHRTALYDGIGQTIKEIPYSYSKLDVIHVLAFTDGCDNASKNYTLDSMTKLLNEKAQSGNLQFTFIQAGNNSTVTNALEANCPKHCTVLNVEDSVKGIKMGFAKAKENIKLRFVVTLPSSESLLRDFGRLQISGPPGVSLNINSSPKRTQNNFSPRTDFSYARPMSSCLPMISHPTHLHTPVSYCQPLMQLPMFSHSVNPNENGVNHTGGKSKTKKNCPGKMNTSDLGQNPRSSSSKKTEKKKSNNSGKKEEKPQQINNNVPKENVIEKIKKEDSNSGGKLTFLIWVGNISKGAKEEDILEFFTQWGDCSVYRVEDLKECRCAVISYKEEKASQLAVKYGNDNSFPGSETKLKVFKY